MEQFCNISSWNQNLTTALPSPQKFFETKTQGFNRSLENMHTCSSKYLIKDTVIGFPIDMIRGK